LLGATTPVPEHATVAFGVATAAGVTAPARAPELAGTAQMR
jgi:hypothetical protein